MSDMELQMVRALAAIDAELGMPEDGCNSPAMTLVKIKQWRAALLSCARKAEALKRDCISDPEGWQAERNAQYQAIATTAHIALGTIRGQQAVETVPQHATEPIHKSMNDVWRAALLSVRTVSNGWVAVDHDGNNVGGGCSLEGWLRAVRWAERQHGIVA